MRNVLLYLTASLLVLSAFTCKAAGESADTSLNDGAVRHIVVFKYKPDSRPEQIKQVTDAFRALKDDIPGILSFEYGVNNSPENLDQGFTHIYQMTFENAQARDTYLPHPQHGKFGELLGELGILDGVFVVDYEIKP
ncbi:Dabb family protein [Alteromonas gilva]|uniref:Dabb family protein n=1 Tax=Alteromonas gilva TaxID=2987522 RepID=A0ABT5L669_9ALTE|nr:Dabb family protein [Alteromonas gilva]MDC8831337.1 Dabb family protein [Alteromonas gilva]